jgi:hypothetical protein
MRFREFAHYRVIVELDEDRYVGVNYNLSGPWPSRSMNDKNSYLLDDPEILNIQVYDIDTGAEITSTITPHERSMIKDSIATDLNKETRGY